MRYEWDENERKTNIQQHGIDFADVIRIFAGPTVEMLDDRFDYGETRFIALGLLNGVVLVVAYTERREALRIISARKATKYEEEKYFEEIAN